MGASPRTRPRLWPVWRVRLVPRSPALRALPLTRPRLRGVPGVRGLTIFPSDGSVAANDQEPPAAASTAPASPQDYPPPPALLCKDVVEWDDDQPAPERYQALGRVLAKTGDLYRCAEYAGGLVLVPADPKIPPREITRGCQLRSVMADRLRVVLVRATKGKRGGISTTELDTMLASEVFLQEFRPLDAVVTSPATMPIFRSRGLGTTTPALGSACSMSVGSRRSIRGSTRSPASSM